MSTITGDIINGGYRSQDGTYGVGDLVTRDGTDVHKVISLEPDGFAGEFVCVVEPALRGNEETPWITLGDTQYNLCRRYSLVEEPGTDGQADELKLQVLQARTEKLEYMKRAHEVTRWHHLMKQLDREYLETMFETAKPALIKMIAAVTDEQPKPQTARERVRALKAHPTSVRGRA